jgi:mannose/cellobiose epimerase-like protein (N-acyl-D-glucosamine 2-epimerase family)
VIRLSLVLVCILSMALLITSDRHHAEGPNINVYKLIKNDLVRHLDNQVLPFWVSPELNNDAFEGLPILDRNLRPTGKVEGHVIVQLRGLYVHAMAISRTTDKTLKTRFYRQYHRKFELLRRNYWDEKKGGFFNYSSDKTANSQDAVKETRSQVHAIYFLAEIYLLIRHQEALQLAGAVFSLIDAAAHDAVYGGYNSYYEVPRDHPQNRVKTLSVQMHMLLAVTRLYQASAEQIYLDRFEEIFEILRIRFEIPNSRGNVYNALLYNWEELPPDGKLDTKTVYGHSAELLWYTLETADAFDKDIRLLRPWLTRLTDALLETGVSRGGAVYFAGAYRGAAEETTIWWWAQAETMVALLRVYEVTGETRYWLAFQKVRLWAFRNLVSIHSGDWLPFTDRWGFQRPPIRGAAYWQSGFHVTRALLQCQKALDRLISQNENLS